MARSDIKSDVIDLLGDSTILKAIYDKPFRLVPKPVYPCACVVILGSTRNMEQAHRYSEKADVLIGLFLHPAKPDQSQQVEDLDDLIDEVLGIFASEEASGSLQIITEDSDDPMVTAEVGLSAVDAEGDMLSWSAMISFVARRVVAV